MYLPDGDAGSVGVCVWLGTLGTLVMMVLAIVLNKIPVINDPYFMVF